MKPKRFSFAKTAAAVIFSLLLSTMILWAHFNWIQPEKHIVPAGKPAAVYIASGHHFPKVEASPSRESLSVSALSPSGGRLELKPILEGKVITAEYSPSEKGLHVIFMEMDRGIMSQTAKGWQPGGRKEHPGARESMKYYVSALTAVRTGADIPAEGRPAGLTFEITGKRDSSAIRLSVLKESKPVEGAEISVVAEGGDALQLGKSDERGEAVYTIPPGYKGRLLFIAAKDTPMPDTADYGLERLRTSLCLYVD